MASPARADAQDQNPVETLGRRKDSKSRNQASKYDYVKVKVWLGAASYNHYYVLSRFLLSRMLTVIKIPHVVAVKIALELKKLLVDHQLLDVSQPDLESFLFKPCSAAKQPHALLNSPRQPLAGDAQARLRRGLRAPVPDGDRVPPSARPAGDSYRRGCRGWQVHYRLAAFAEAQPTQCAAH
eukprot:scaffold2707_cov417-Prasinococcus_capsulatus_cf.AAC.29